MADVTYIEGLEDCIRFLDSLPGNTDRCTRKAFRAGSRAVGRKARPRIPKRWRALYKGKVFKGKSSKQIQALIGLFNGGQQNGRPNSNGVWVDDWFKAYWANYGTLSHRDPSHKFDTPVKAHVARRNNAGQMAERYFENAISGWRNVFYNAFVQSMKEQEQELYSR